MSFLSIHWGYFQAFMSCRCERWISGHKIKWGYVRCIQKAFCFTMSRLDTTEIDRHKNLEQNRNINSGTEIENKYPEIFQENVECILLQQLKNLKFFCKLDLYKVYIHVKVESSLVQAISTHRYISYEPINVRNQISPKRIYSYYRSDFTRSWRNGLILWRYCNPRLNIKRMWKSCNKLPWKIKRIPVTFKQQQMRVF